MTTTATCPVCGAEQHESLLCHACTTTLERALGDVPSIVADLDVTVSRMSRIGTSGKGGLASEKTPIHLGAVQVADDLTNTLTTWARDACGEQVFAYWLAHQHGHPAAAGARALAEHIPAIRRHPAVNELVDEITDAIRQARRVVDRPGDRVYLGQCLVETPHDATGVLVTCYEEIYAREGASSVTCKVCGITHDTAERQHSLLDQAEDQLFTLKEVARIIGSYGGMKISESTIRSYVSTGQLAYHGKTATGSLIRLGDLLTVIAGHAAKPQSRKLKRAV